MRFVEANGVRVSAIGVGTWQFGSAQWGYGDQYADVEAGRIIERALDLGVNLIDTAEIYGRGRSERIVGREVARLGARDRAFIATKMLPVAPFGPVVAARGRASRKRLGVDVIDLYQLHAPNPAVPMRSQVAGLRRLEDEGVIRHAGVSNYSLSRWLRAQEALGRPVLSNQVSFSLAVRGPAHDLVPWAAAHDRIVIAYSPLAQGLLSGRYDASNRPGGVRRNNALFLPENLAAAAPLLDGLREVATAHEATPAQVALAWVIRHPNVVAIPGASSVSQLEHNIAAVDLKLTQEEAARLTDAADAFEPLRGPAAVPQIVRHRFHPRAAHSANG
jgi:aryl-alcohol dehydrogenase-like predicted oxidoreductase